MAIFNSYVSLPEGIDVQFSIAFCMFTGGDLVQIFSTAHIESMSKSRTPKELMWGKAGDLTSKNYGKRWQHGVVMRFNHVVIYIIYTYIYIYIHNIYIHNIYIYTSFGSIWLLYIAMEISMTNGGFDWKIICKLSIFHGYVK